MTTGEKIRFVIIRSIGNFLLLFALFGVGATFGPALYYEGRYRLIQARGIHFTVGHAQISFAESDSANAQENKPQQPVQEVKLTQDLADILAGEKEQILIPIDPLFNVLIPKIGANSRVFPNVDPSNSDVFIPILRQGVAHARGTVFPGQKGNVYLFAHSTDNFWDVGRYNAIFYLLKDLRAGDDVVVFSQNVRHNYVVTGSSIVSSSEVSLITNAQTSKEQLILQTCWPPGTTWQRLMVFAEPK